MINPAEHMFVLPTVSDFRMFGQHESYFLLYARSLSSAMGIIRYGSRPPHCQYVRILCVAYGCCDT